MTDGKIELNRRRVLGGIATVGIAAAAAGAGTFAAFSDTENSSGNTVQAGTLDLESAGSASFPMTGLVPGDSVAGTVTSTYSSNSSVSPIDVTVDLSITENDAATTPTDATTNLSASGFAELIELTTADLSDSNGNTYDLLSNAGTTTGPGGNTYTSLADIEAYDAPTDALSSVTPGDDVTLDLQGTFVSTAGNDAQGDGVDLTVTFTANQQ